MLRNFSFNHERYGKTDPKRTCYQTYISDSNFIVHTDLKKQTFMFRSFTPSTFANHPFILPIQLPFNLSTYANHPQISLFCSSAFPLPASCGAEIIDQEQQAQIKVVQDNSQSRTSEPQRAAGLIDPPEGQKVVSRSVCASRFWHACGGLQSDRP